MGTEVDRLESDLGCVRNILRSWRRLPPDQRPRKPTILLSCLRDAYQFPYPDFFPPSRDPQRYLSDVDGAYDSFVSSARKLLEVASSSEHWHVVPYILDARMADASPDQLYRQFLENRLPAFLEELTALPHLKERVARSGRGRDVKRPLMRLMIIVICWYVLNVEGEPLKAGFNDEGWSNSRLSQLVATTLAGMGVDLSVSALRTELKHAKSQPLRGIKFWDLIPTLPPSAL